MFEGCYPLTLDAKGRLTIPVELRGRLMEISQGKVTVTRHFGTYLRAYPQPEWEVVRQQMQALPANLDSARRLIVGTADPVEIDGAGRILISPVLRKAIKLDRRVVLVGDLTRFEIWDEDVHARYLDEQALAGLPQDLHGVRGL